jgi:hypothetical protein
VARYHASPLYQAQHDDECECPILLLSKETPHPSMVVDGFIFCVHPYAKEGLIDIHEESDLPDWIKKHQVQKAAEKKQAQDEQGQQLKASALIHEKGSEFWQELVERIETNMKALKELEGAELVGSVSHSDRGSERNCRFQANRQSVRFGPELSHMSFWHIPGKNRIRRWYQDQNAGEIELVAYGGEVRALANNRPITARELADLTIQRMVEKVKVRRV